MELSQIQDTIKKAGDSTPKWLSRKLIITIALIVGFFWMFNLVLPLIIWPVTILAAIWLVCQSINDLKTSDNEQRLKEKLLEIYAKSTTGVTPQNVEDIKKI